MSTTYGEGWEDLIHDKIKALMDELITQNTTDSPRIAYVYDRHHTAGMSLPAVSVGTGGINQQWRGQSTGAPWPTWHTEIELRIHTGYGPEAINDRELLQLIQGVANKLFANLDLGDGYRVHEILTVSPEDFYDADSYTKGGSLTVDVIVDILYTQE